MMDPIQLEIEAEWELSCEARAEARRLADLAFRAEVERRKDKIIKRREFWRNLRRLFQCRLT